MAAIPAMLSPTCHPEPLETTQGVDERAEGSRCSILCDAESKRSLRNVSVELPIAAWVAPASSGFFDCAVPPRHAKAARVGDPGRFCSGFAQNDKPWNGLAFPITRSPNYSRSSHLFLLIRAYPRRSTVSPSSIASVPRCFKVLVFNLGNFWQSRRFLQSRLIRGKFRFSSAPPR